MADRTSGSRTVGHLRLLIVFALVFGACSQSGPDELEDQVSGATDDGETVSPAVVAAAVERFGVPVERLQFDPPVELDPSDCVIHPVWDIESTDPNPVPFAFVPGDRVIDRHSDGAVGQVLSACFDGPGLEPSAGAVARIVVLFDRTPGPLQVLDDGQARFAEDRGLTYEPPTLAIDGETRTVTFLAIDREIELIQRVTVTRMVGSEPVVEYTELG